tara:strand:- start:308 stop:457 length:150 start_codon:yes stop_codon:yes gene_type:complete
MGKGDKWRKGHSLKKFGESYDDIDWSKGNSDKINYGKNDKTKNNRKKSG